MPGKYTGYGNKTKEKCGYLKTIIHILQCIQHELGHGQWLILIN
jgi:hypothetical protein